MDLEMEDL